MATQAQIDANRRNSQKSTGPRTPEGKAAVSRNALKHGFRSQDVVLPGEDPDGDFSLLLEELNAEWQPDTLTDRTLVEDLAGVLWRQQRAARIERGTFIAAGEVATDKIWGRPTPPDPDQHHEIGTRILAEAYAIAAESLDRIHRHQDRLDRSQARLLRQLESRSRTRTRNERSNPIPAPAQGLQPCSETVRAASAPESPKAERSNPIAINSQTTRLAGGTIPEYPFPETERSKPISAGIRPSDFYSLASAEAARTHRP